jgi:ABC-type antimicrobial peptide transport system permease subunit
MLTEGEVAGRGTLHVLRALKVVGVVDETRLSDLRERHELAVYLPVFQQPDFLQYAFLYVGAKGQPRSIMAAVESQVRAAGREFVRSAETTSHAIDVNLAEERMLASLSTFFAVVAGFLAIIGLFGLLSYSVTRRIGEFGVRMALGAQARNVFFTVFKEALILLFTGIVVGLPAAAGAATILANRLSSVSAHDAVPFLAAAGLLAIAGAIAAWVPARRASRVNPIDALRQE